MECAENCEICSPEGFCSKCREGYILSDSNTCAEILYLSPSFSASEYPNVYALKFQRDEEKELVRKFVEKLASSPITIFKIFLNSGAENLTVKSTINDVRPYDFSFQLTLKMNVSKGTLIYLDIEFQDWMNEFKTLKLRNFTFVTLSIMDFFPCPNGELFRKG